jgi:hypothetical protein
MTTVAAAAMLKVAHLLHYTVYITLTDQLQLTLLFVFYYHIKMLQTK